MKRTNCGGKIEEGDWVFSDGVSKCICSDCLQDEVDDLPIRDLARILGYDMNKAEDDEDEEPEKPEVPEQIPGQMDIWGVH